MTTLADLRSEIADDLDRTDIDNQITSEITKAIRYYQNTRFYFNETRDPVFDTVSGQNLYSSEDLAEIEKFIEIDQILLTDGSQTYELQYMGPMEWEVAVGNGSNSRPLYYTKWNNSIGVYPTPDGEYQIRLVGQIIIDPPADEVTPGNAWMDEALDLIRARVCAQLARRKLRDVTLFQMHSAAEIDEFNRLFSETAGRVGSGEIVPTEF